MQPTVLLNWENALDLIGIAIGLLIIVYLCYNRRKYRRRLPASRPAADFQQTVRLEWFKQRSQAALTAIAAKVAAEQRQLQQWFTEAEFGKPANSQDGPTVSADRPHRVTPLPGAVSDPETGGSDYARLDDLAETGLTVEQMAEQTCLPVDEIQLYLQTRQHFLEVRNWKSGSNAGYTSK